MAYSSWALSSTPYLGQSPRRSFSVTRKPYFLAFSADDSPRPLLRTAANSNPKARFVARRRESVTVRQLARPLKEYMSLPASHYSVLDAERIEQIDENTFRCYVYRFKFLTFEVCPVLVVRVELQSNGCCIKLLSCKLEGSPIVAAQNDKFDAYMMNQISYDVNGGNSPLQKLTSDTVIEVNIEIPFAFRAIPVQAIESAGDQVLEQILKIMLPRFTAQLVKDYQAWASGDASRQPLERGNTQHWLVRIDKLGIGVVTKAQMVDYYVQILTKVLGNEKDAEMCIYHISWQSNFGFCCELDEECATQLAGVPGVLSIHRDTNFDSENKDYGEYNVQKTLDMPDSSKTDQRILVNTTKLFITGLSFYTSEKTLRGAFEGFGELVEVKIIMDKISKRSKGYAFIEYTTEEAATAALKEMNGKIINGWMIVVDVAKPSPRRYSGTARGQGSR